MTSLRAAIFCHDTIIRDNPTDIAEISTLLHALHSGGIKIVVFSNNTRLMAELVSDRGYPPVDLYLTKSIVGKTKGAKEWIDQTTQMLGVKSHELVYVGDDMMDWTTAINSAVLYLHAVWSKGVNPEITSVLCNRPIDVHWLLWEYLLREPRWEYTLDVPEIGLHLRTLLDRSAVLPATNPSSFNLVNVFTHKLPIMVGNVSARNILMHHAVTSLYLEGLIKPMSFFAIYPSSTPGQVNNVMGEFVDPVAKTFRGYYKDDLIVRHTQAVDTSMIRAGNGAVSPTEQMNSVCLNPDYSGTARSKTLTGRTIIVFDDFTTKGTSLDWARNLFVIAGVSKVILVSIGRYGTQHHALIPTRTAITPFVPAKYRFADFRSAPHPPVRQEGAQQQMSELFRLRVERS